MRKLLGVFVFIVTLFGCEIPTSDLVLDMDMLAIQFKSLDDVFTYVNQNISYAKDVDIHGQADYWQSPEETYNRKTGDCEDIALFICYFAERMNYKATLLTVDEASGQGHVLFVINQITYDYTGVYKKTGYSVWGTYTLDQALAKCRPYNPKQVLDKN